MTLLTEKYAQPDPELMISQEIFILCESGIKSATVTEKNTIEIVVESLFKASIKKEFRYQVSTRSKCYDISSFILMEGHVWARTKEELLEKL